MTLYDTDFLSWTEEQAAKLRALAENRANLDLDLANLAEEVSSMGRSDVHAAAIALTLILEHLLKLQHSPARERRLDWAKTVREQRRDLRRRFRDSPSLKAELDIHEAYADARIDAIEALAGYGEADAAASVPGVCPYGLDQALDEQWWPGGTEGPLSRT